MTEFDEIERVARALCRAENDDPGDGVYGAIDENERNRYRHMARAAIETIRATVTADNR